MAKYKVIEGFIDEIEGKSYRTTDPFIVGPKTDKNRLKALSTETNKQGRPLIKLLGEPKVKQGE